jgi:hypothetical protein
MLFIGTFLWGGEHQGLTHDLPKDHLAPRSTKLWPKTQKKTKKNHGNLGGFLDPPRFSNPSASPRFIPSTRNK